MDSIYRCCVNVCCDFGCTVIIKYIKYTRISDNYCKLYVVKTLKYSILYIRNPELVILKKRWL